MRVVFLVLCFAVFWSAWPTSAAAGPGMELTRPELLEMEPGRQADAEAKVSGPYGSCWEEPSKVSGKYMLQLGPDKAPFEVFCEQKKYGGGWIVLQNRFDGKENFLRNWTDYRNGFGDLDGEFWLGLEHVHDMTSRSPHELLVEVTDFFGMIGYANYSVFEIGNEIGHYRIQKLEFFNGTARDSMDDNRDEKFSTPDRDNDKWDEGHCASTRQGPWWHYSCSSSNLNGLYKNTTNDNTAMYWHGLEYDYRGMASSLMMIRQKKA